MNFDLLELKDEDMDAFYGEVTTTVESAVAAIKKEETAPVAAKTVGTGPKVGLIGVNVDFGISIYEAKLRIFDCCNELGLTSENPVLYSDVQQVYRDKHKVTLNKDELKKLFGSQKAKAIINDRFRSELYCEAEDGSDGAPQLIKLHPGKDIHQIISILEESTALDKIGREADQEEAEAMSVTLGPPEPVPKPFKQPERLLPADFKVVDCRNKNPVKNALGFLNRHKKPAPDGSVPLRDILDTMKRKVIPIPAIQSDNDEDFDAEAAWKEQVEESKRLAIERTEMILQMRRAAEEAARKEAEEAEKEYEKKFNPDEIECNFLGMSFGKKVDFEIIEGPKSVKVKKAKVEKAKVVEVEKLQDVEVEKAQVVEVEKPKVVEVKKPQDIDPGILTSSIAQPVDAAIFPELAEKQPLAAQRPIPPPRKPISATTVTQVKPTAMADVPNTFPVVPIAAPTVPARSKPSVFAPKPVSPAADPKPIPTTTVAAKPITTTLPAAAIDPTPVTPATLSPPKPFKATLLTHDAPEPFARNSDPLVNYNPSYPNVKTMPPRKFVTPEKSTSPPPSPRLASTITVNPAPTLPEKAAITTDAIDELDLNISPQSTSRPSSNKSSKKTGTTVVDVSPEAKSKSSSPPSKLPDTALDDSVDARVLLQAITNDIGLTFKKATKKVDRYIEQVLREEEAAIAALKKKNDNLVKEYKKKMEARLEKKLQKKLAEQDRLMMICKAMNDS